jgi:hypothetical protein
VHLWQELTILKKRNYFAEVYVLGQLRPPSIWESGVMVIKLKTALVLLIFEGSSRKLLKCIYSESFPSLWCNILL